MNANTQLFDNEKQEIAGIVENVLANTPEEFHRDFDYFYDTAGMQVFEHLRFCGSVEFAELHTEKLVMQSVKVHFPKHYVSPIQQFVRSNIAPLPKF